MSPYPPASARGQYWPGSDEDGGRRRRGGRAEADWPGETGARTDATGYPQANGYATTDGQDPRGDGWPDSLDGSSWSAADQGRLGGRSRHGRRRSSLAGASGPGRRRAPRVAPARVTIGIALAAVAGVALLAVAAFSLWPGSGKTPSRSHTTSVQQAVVLRPASAAGFDPLTSHKNDPGDEHSSLARYAIDDSMRTAWSSQGYLTSAFGGLKAGSGLIVDMGKPVRFAKVTVTFGSSPGADINLLAGNSADLSQANLASMTTIASANDAMGTMTFTIRSSAAERYLVVWFTKLPHQPGSKWYTAVIYNVQVQGSS